jgi:hypothetical protein
MTNIKILYHMMPWEIDYALLTFKQLKKSKYYLTKNISDIAGNKFILVYYIDNNNVEIPIKYILNI